MAQLVARVLWEHDAAGSSPVTPTIDQRELLRLSFSLKVCDSALLCISRVEFHSLTYALHIATSALLEGGYVAVPKFVKYFHQNHRIQKR